MCKFLITTCLLLACAVSAAAQPTEHSLRLSTAVFAGAATADWVSTYQMTQRGAVEKNRLYAWTDKRPVLLVTVGTVSDVVGVWAWNTYVGKHHPKIATIGLYVMAGFRVYLAVHNSRLCTSADSRQGADRC